jgi:predicted urease superfamily metal-dependent hydrolase
VRARAEEKRQQKKMIAKQAMEIAKTNVDAALQLHKKSFFMGFYASLSMVRVYLYYKFIFY